ncbi:MAG: HAMP domain-containing sensor histidine kinase [Gemmatimonas sp.]
MKSASPTSVESLVRAAAEAVAQRWSRAALLPHEESVAESALAIVVDAVLGGTRGERLPSLASYPWTAEAPRLIAELRREVIVIERGSTVPASEVLLLLGQMEHLLVALEDDVASQFVEHLIGPHALQLLVEIAHDVRSPLGSILFLVERMRRGGTGPVSPMQERHLGLVYSAAFGLSSMASDLMELARGGARLVAAGPVAFSIADVLHAVRDVVQPIAEEKGLSLRFSGPLTDVRIGHPAAISRVLLNLVTNALKFTNNGLVTVVAEEQGDEHVCFRVEDTGRGMPSGVAARITEVFARPCATGEYAFSSAGLGIAICRKLVDAMQGSLTIVPSNPIGTRVEVTLPLPVSGI